MALKRAANGTYSVTSLKQAKEALQLHQSLKDEIEEIRKANELPEMEMDAAELKKAVTYWAIHNRVERIDFDSGFHATLIEQFMDSHFILEDDDLPDPESGYQSAGKVVPLKTILEKKFKSKVTDKGSKARKVWLRITKRVVDNEALDAVVAEGVLNVDDVKAAFVQKPKAPYLRIFED